MKTDTLSTLTLHSDGTGTITLCKPCRQQLIRLGKGPAGSLGSQIDPSRPLPGAPGAWCEWCGKGETSR